ncbi:MAG: DUF1552 domain-containing protein [Planctomycetota bacterium]|nr:DUF1552 domain-containing protein [Planctomycetota bacterium]MEC9032898.1 DUF1552 domain-containing protein [Planctomycetota bacterium]MEC9350449.1 DUF1552 domain-containing protein [Planctomycetota bacterium]
MSKAINRRHFLRGAGVAIALPMLEAMGPSLKAAAINRKPVKRVVCISNNYGIYKKAFFPKEAGSNYEMPDTLKPLAKHRKDFTVFSHLDHGIPGGHACVPTFLNGVRPYLAANYPEGNISLDQKAAEHVGAATRYPSMVLKVNESNLVSFTRTGVQVPAVDLRQTYRALFLDEGPQAKARMTQTLKRHTSILDVVLGEAKSLNRHLGRQDQRKFGEYLDSVRSLEKKIVQQRPWIDRPKPKTELPEPKPGQGTVADLKAMIELIALAIQTDSTRAITLTSGFRSGDLGLSGGYHGFSHHGEREKEVAALKLIERNQIAQTTHLVELLKNQEDPINGGTLFDHTMILFGCGMATGQHSTRDLPLLLAGGGFRHGEHKVYPDEKGKRVPAANLLLSMLQNFGLEIDRFGTSTGTLTGLETKA